MSRFPVTINPDMPAVHTGQGVEQRRRARRLVRPVITAGQASAYAGSAGAVGVTQPDPEPTPGTEPSVSQEDCCG